MQTIDPAAAQPCDKDDGDAHPLEIIPYFRRIPRGLGRDLLYTFLWNCGFAVFFYLISSLFSARFLSPPTMVIQFLIANIVGYTIHLCFSLGDLLGLRQRAHSGGTLATIAYYALLPSTGVIVGFWITSFTIDIGFRGWLSKPGWLLSVLFTSLVVSMVMTMVFFWRERGAKAEAELERGRLHTERVEREALGANLRALQAQIEPHFLFNTLANVTSLIDSDAPKAKHMLESFIRFLRSSLAATRTESTTIAAEADLITSYLEVLQVRMGSRLCGRVEVDPALRGYNLPPVLVQPIVENAIRHGLEPKVEGGEIRMVVRRDGEKVAIDVIDTGVGFASATAGGLGLTNIRERLKLLYGDGASLEIRDNAPAGTIVTMRLPQ